MPINYILLGIRGLIYARRDVQRYQEGKPQRDAERANRKALEAENEAKEIAEYSAFWKERGALRKTIARLRLQIDEVEQTDAVAYYVERGVSDSEAYRSYRTFLEDGGRFPGNRSESIAAGRRFRKRHGWLTREDKEIIKLEDEARQIKDQAAAIRSTKILIVGWSILLGILCIISLGLLVTGEVEAFVIVGALAFILLLSIKFLRRASR